MPITHLTLKAVGKVKSTKELNTLHVDDFFLTSKTGVDEKMYRYFIHVRFQTPRQSELLLLKALKRTVLL